MIGDTVVGAIGVSGAASAQQDDDIAQAAADAFVAGGAPAEVGYWSRNAVEKAFAKGMPIHETSDYKVHASRRDGPGEAEVHVTETDIFYVLEGSARFVTGGELVEPREVGPNELRSAGIEGGSARELKAGDLIIIPKGVPHWFESVPGPFTYYVVKSVD
jgi:glc operon protein GlcG